MEWNRSGVYSTCVDFIDLVSSLPLVAADGFKGAVRVPFGVFGSGCHGCVASLRIHVSTCGEGTLTVPLDPSALVSGWSVGMAKGPFRVKGTVRVPLRKTVSMRDCRCMYTTLLPSYLLRSPFPSIHSRTPVERMGPRGPSGSPHLITTYPVREPIPGLLAPVHRCSALGRAWRYRRRRTAAGLRPR